MGASWKRRTVLGLFGGLLILGALLGGLGPRPVVTPGSVDSSEPDGRRAARMLLAELGFRNETWNHPPGALPAGQHFLWLACVPEGAGAGPGGSGLQENAEREQEENEREVGNGSARDLGQRHDLRHYQRFLLQGGTIVMPYSEGARAFVSESLELELGPELEAQLPSTGSRHVVLPGGERIEVASPKVGSLERDASPPAAWLSDGEGRGVAWRFVHGRGTLVLLASLDFLDNDSIGEHDHGLFFVRLLEELDGGGRVLFDEYALGNWSPQSLGELAFSAPLRGISLQLFLLILVFTWRSAWPRRFPRDPEPFERVSPLARARARASLFARAGRLDLSAQLLRRGVLERIAARTHLSAGLPSRVSSRALSSGLDVPDTLGQTLEHSEEHTEQHPERDRELLRAIALRSGHERELERWTRAFAGAPPANAAQLEELERELASIESAVFGSQSAPSSPSSSSPSASASPRAQAQVARS